MKNLLDFLIKNDVYKPDFAAKAYDEGLVREVCVGEGAEPMSSRELELLADVTDKYYADYW